MVKGPWATGSRPEETPKEVLDLTFVDEIIANNWNYLSIRENKNVLKQLIVECFHENVATMFNDQYGVFIRNINTDSKLHESFLIYVQNIAVDLIRPEEYLRRYIQVNNKIVAGFNEKNSIEFGNVEEINTNLVRAIMFIHRFVLDRFELFVNIPEPEPDPGKPDAKESPSK